MFLYWCPHQSGRVDGWFDDPNYSLYITTSNCFIIDGKLSTPRRFREISLLPTIANNNISIKNYSIDICLHFFHGNIYWWPCLSVLSNSYHFTDKHSLQVTMSIDTLMTSSNWRRLSSLVTLSTVKWMTLSKLPTTKLLVNQIFVGTNEKDHL